MEELSKRIGLLQNLVDGYQPACFGVNAERKRTSDFLASQYEVLFSKLQQLVDNAMCMHFLARGVLNDEEAEQLALVEDALSVQELYNAMDREYLILIQCMQYDSFHTSRSCSNTIPCITSANLDIWYSLSLVEKLLGVITLLEDKDQEFLGEKNGVAPTLEMIEELTKKTFEEGKAVSVGRVRDVFSLICYLLYTLGHLIIIL